MTKREHWLLIISVQVVIIIGFIIYHQQVQKKRIQQLDSYFSRANKKKTIPKESNEDPERLKREIRELEEQLASARKNLNAIRGEFASRSEPELIQRVAVEISEAAKKNDIVVFSNTPFLKPEDFQGGPLVNVLSFDSDYERNLRKMVIESSFPELKRFLADLREIPYQVLLVDLSLRALPRGVSSRGRRIHTELILAL